MSDDLHTMTDGRSIRVLHDQVLVQFEKTPEVTEGGIIIPSKSHDHLGDAVVLAFGEIRKKRGVAKLDVTKGDRVLAVRALAEQGSNPGLQKSFGDDYAILQPADIIGVRD
jgi:co-chaperonin GroES (HSP10)